MLGFSGRIAVFFVFILPLTILIIAAIITYWYLVIPSLIVGWAAIAVFRRGRR